MASALKEELTRFYKLPSPCGVGMDLEVDMRGSVRVASLQPRMSAAASGAGGRAPPTDFVCTHVTYLVTHRSPALGLGSTV